MTNVVFSFRDLLETMDAVSLSKKVGSTEYTKEYITSYFLAKKLLLTTTCTITTTSLFRNKMFMFDEMT